MSTLNIIRCLSLSVIRAAVKENNSTPSGQSELRTGIRPYEAFITLYICYFSSMNDVMWFVNDFILCFCSPVMQWMTVQFWIVSLVTSTILLLKATKKFFLSSRSSDPQATLSTSAFQTAIIESAPTTTSLGKSSGENDVLLRLCRWFFTLAVSKVKLNSVISSVISLVM